MEKIDKNSRILITGGSGLVGTALADNLRSKDYRSVVSLSRKECDLLDKNATIKLFSEVQPTYVFHLAATVYGIMGNLHNQGSSFLENSLINLNVIEASRLAKVQKIVVMGTCAGYPLVPPNSVLKESEFLHGDPHESEYGYAQAKRAMLTQLISYQKSYPMRYAYAISTNLYGCNDKFDLEYGHVIPSLIRKFYEAKQTSGKVQVWGDGTVQRDFLFSEDAAEALYYMLQHLEGPVNMASGQTSSIKEAVGILAAYLNMQDQIEWDHSKPNGRAFIQFDNNKLSTVGFKANTSLSEGLKRTFDWFAANATKVRK